MYYGAKRWDGPYDIYDMLDLPPEVQQMALPYIHNYKMNLIHMTDLPEEVRKRFTSDFRLVAEYLSCKNDKEKLRELLKNDDWKITHIEDFLDVMSKIGTDKRYKEIKETIIERPEKEEVTMCLIAEELENKGIAKGIEKGIEKGIKDGINKTIEILKDMGIPMDEIKQKVARKYNMTPEQIEEIMNE